MARRRWDVDARGIGIADAAAWRPVVEDLAAIADTRGWVAEEPELHLLPHLAAAADGSPLRLRRAAAESDGTFVVELDWVSPEQPTRKGVRLALFALLATITETLTVIHEPPAARGRELEVLTGVRDGDGVFAAHGHTLRLRVAVADAGTTPPQE
jgi:hypothetical protein